MRRLLTLAPAYLLLLAACAAPSVAPATVTVTPAAPTSAPVSTPAGASSPTAAPKQSSASTKPAVGLLRIAIPNDEGTLTPYTYKFGYPGWNMLSLVYDTILQLDAEQTPRPLLATEVRTSPDGASYDITLRSDLRWHDGKPLTADDVKFTFEFFLANTQGRFTPALRPVESVITTGPDKLTVRLKAPNPSFPIRALADVPIIPRHVWDGVSGDKAKETPAMIGSGPYELVDVSDTGYRMRANDDYFLGPPPVAELQFPVIKDPTTALQALRAGEIDAWTQELPPEQVQQFNQAPLKVARGPNFSSTLLQLNDERPPFERMEVRQAIDLAIDKKRLVDTILLGTGTVATPGFIHPDSAFHDPAVRARFDPQQANQLLDHIGAAPGADGVRSLGAKPFDFTLLVYANNPLRIRTAELIAGMLKDVGFRVTVRTMDANTVDARVWPDFDAAKGRDYDLAMWGWSASLQVDVARIVDLVYSDFSIGRSNIGAFASPNADRIANDLRTAVEESKRRESVRALETTIADEVPFVMLYFQDGAYAYRAQVFDKWTYQKGQGIFNKLSFLPGFGH